MDHLSDISSLTASNSNSGTSTPRTLHSSSSSSTGTTTPVHPLPKIACFHGGGSNASIHQIQCAPLARLLKGKFELVFFDAPFISLRPGPDILPFFKSHSPFRTWFKPLGTATAPMNTEEGEIRAGIDDGSGYDALNSEGLERVHKLMSERGAAEEWVGALGFSQGTRVVAGLLADQEARERLGWATRRRLMFGVLCCGSRGPMTGMAVKAASHDLGDGDDAMGTVSGEVDDDGRTVHSKISTTSIHVHGLKDIQLENGRVMKEKFYDEESARLLEIDYHHAMPWHRGDVEALAGLIREVYHESGGES